MGTLNDLRFLTPSEPLFWAELARCLGVLLLGYASFWLLKPGDLVHDFGWENAAVCRFMATAEIISNGYGFVPRVLLRIAAGNAALCFLSYTFACYLFGKCRAEVAEIHEYFSKGENDVMRREIKSDRQPD